MFDLFDVLPKLTIAVRVWHIFVCNCAYGQLQVSCVFQQRLEIPVQWIGRTKCFSVPVLCKFRCINNFKQKQWLSSLRCWEKPWLPGNTLKTKFAQSACARSYFAELNRHIFSREHVVNQRIDFNFTSKSLIVSLNLVITWWFCLALLDWSIWSCGVELRQGFGAGLGQGARGWGGAWGGVGCGHAKGWG